MWRVDLFDYCYFYISRIDKYFILHLIKNNLLGVVVEHWTRSYTNNTIFHFCFCLFPIVSLWIVNALWKRCPRSFLFSLSLSNGTTNLLSLKNEKHFYQRSVITSLPLSHFPILSSLHLLKTSNSIFFLEKSPFYLSLLHSKSKSHLPKPQSSKLFTDLKP